MLKFGWTLGALDGNTGTLLLGIALGATLGSILALGTKLGMTEGSELELGTFEGTRLGMMLTLGMYDGRPLGDVGSPVLVGSRLIEGDSDGLPLCEGDDESLMLG